jgi:uncharacterized membrane protein
VAIDARIAPMTATDVSLLVVTHSRDAAYDVILLAHVLSAAVGLGALAIAGANAWALRRSGPDPEPIRRYYRPGVNWAGRVLFLVPVLGLVLMAMSHGDWSFSEGWIMVGLTLWVLVAVSAEMYLWPAERRLQAAVSAATALSSVDGGGTVAGTGETRVDTTAVESGAGSIPEGDEGSGLRAECLRVAVTSAALGAVLIAAAVVMVAKP